MSQICAFISDKIEKRETYGYWCKTFDKFHLCFLIKFKQAAPVQTLCKAMVCLHT